MEKSAVTVDEIENFSPGPMQQTDNALDLAINNEGFFTIDTPLVSALPVTEISS